MSQRKREDMSRFCADLDAGKYAGKTGADVYAQGCADGRKDAAKRIRKALFGDAPTIPSLFAILNEIEAEGLS